jgi:hypothetical protein
MKRVVEFGAMIGAILVLVIAVGMIVSGIIGLSGCSEKDDATLGIEIAKHDIEKEYGFKDVVDVEITPFDGKEGVYIFRYLVYEEIRYQDARLFEYTFSVKIETEEDGDVDVDTELIYHGGHDIGK